MQKRHLILFKQGSVSKPLHLLTESWNNGTYVVTN